MGSELSKAFFFRGAAFSLWLCCGSFVGIPAAEAETGETAPVQRSSADKETARNLMDIGHAKLEAGDYAAALKAYQGADELMGVTSTGLGVGKALAKLGRLLEAREKLMAVARIPAKADERRPLAMAREEAARLQLDIANRIPSITLALSGPPSDTPTTIEINGKVIPESLRQLPRKLDPGTHTVAASAPGYQRVEKSVVIAEGEHPTVSINLELSTSLSADADTSDGPETEAFPSTLAWIGYGSATGFLVLGSITGAMSLSAGSDAKALCNANNQCPEAARSDRDTSLLLAHFSTASFVLAGVGAAVGTYALLFDNGGLLTEARLGPGYVGIAGQF